MYNPESPTGEDEEDSSKKRGIGNSVGPKLTRLRLRGIKAGTLKDKPDGERKGVSAEDGRSNGSTSSSFSSSDLCSSPASDSAPKNCVVVVSVGHGSSEDVQEELTDLAAAVEVSTTEVSTTEVSTTEVSTTEVSTTEVASMEVASMEVASMEVASMEVASMEVASMEVETTAEEEMASCRSGEGSTLDDSSLTSATDSQASSSEGAQTKRKRGRPLKGDKAAPQTALVEGPATRRQSVRLRSGRTAKRPFSPTMTPSRKGGRSTPAKAIPAKEEKKRKAQKKEPATKGKRIEDNKDEEKDEEKAVDLEKNEEGLGSKTPEDAASEVGEDPEEMDQQIDTEEVQEEEIAPSETLEVPPEKEADYVSPKHKEPTVATPSEEVAVQEETKPEAEVKPTATETTLKQEVKLESETKPKLEEKGSLPESDMLEAKPTTPVNETTDVQSNAMTAESSKPEVEEEDLQTSVECATSGDHRDRRYYSSPQKPSLNQEEPEVNSKVLTPRSARRKSRWEDSESKTVSEPARISLSFEAPSWTETSSQESRDNDEEASLLPPPPPPRVPSPQRRDSLSSLDACRPEKVKSRWRRSSELETRDVGPTATSNSSPGSCSPCDRPSSKGDLSNRGILEDTQREKTPPSAPSKEMRESRDSGRERESTRERGSSGASSTGSSPSKSSSPPLGYEDIEENLYRFERRKSKSKKEVRRMICDCSLTKDERDRGIMGCDEDCLNRLLMIECGSRCPNGDNCSNRRFQKKSYIKVEKFMTDKKGWGLKTLETLASGAFVMEYVGEVLTPEDFRKRVKQYSRDNHQHYYFMALRSDEIIDATQKGNVSRFINHSCDPNCETQKWTVNGELRIGFFTRRPLRSGEELTFDYQFQRYGKEAQKCYCESSNCRGYIGEDNKMSLKSSRNLTPKRAAKKAEERKRDTVEDLAMEEEIEKLSGGLRNREHTLLLARLMVRGEDIDTRRRLLNIITSTTETACLRLFLDYHGLSLLWSWMVDIPDHELALKAEILTVLRQLPIPNKTMVKDSKVMSVVHRWASQLAEGRLQGGDMTPPEKLPKIAAGEDAGAGGSDSDASESSTGCQTPASGQPSAPCSLVGAVVCSPDSTNPVENGDSTPSDPASGEKVVKELTQLASTLLDSWSELKEVFRIPRLEQQKRREDEREADRRERERNRQQRNSNRESNSGWSSGSRDSSSRRRSSPAPSSRERREREYDRSDRRHYSVSPERREDRKPYHRSSEHRRQGSGDSGSSSSKPRKTLLPTPPRLSKEERRQLFALEVQQRDQEEALRRQFLVSQPAAQTNAFLPPSGMVSQVVPQGNPMVPQGNPMVHQCNPMIHQANPMVPQSNPMVPQGNPMVPQANPMLPQGNPMMPQGNLMAPHQQQPLFLYDPAIYGSAPPQAIYYDPNTGAPLPAQAPPTPQQQQEYIMQHNAMLGAPPQQQGLPLLAAGEGVPPMVLQPGAMLPNQGAMLPSQGPLLPQQQIGPIGGIMTAPLPPQESSPPQTQQNTINYQALSAAVAAVSAMPQLPSPAMQRDASLYVTDPMQIPLPPPLSPDDGEVTPQNLEPVSSPVPDGEEAAQEEEPVARTPIENVEAARLIAERVAREYECLATPSPVQQQQQLTYSAPTEVGFKPTPAAGLVSYAPAAVAAQPGLVVVSQASPTAVYQSNLTGPYGPGYVAVPSQATVQPQPFYVTPVVNEELQVQAQSRETVALVRRLASPPPQQPVPPKNNSDKLPPHWKTAKDEEGNIYYYHALTRETTWDLPSWDEEETDMDLGTPTYDEPKVNSTVAGMSMRVKKSSSKKKTLTAAADTSEVAKKIKELFRSKISSHIVHCLNPFRKPDCKLGRIQSTEDFKHLARKLTHFVMAKELKHCKNVEDLECNENVKHKAREFINKYMAKYGPIYKKDKTVSPKDE